MEKLQVNGNSGVGAIGKFRALARKGMDSWKNAFTGMGVKGHDKTASTSYMPGIILSQTEQADLYECEGMASNIIDTYVKDMHRDGFNIMGDKDAYLEDNLKRLQFKKRSPEATTWSYVFGGGLFVFGLADGAEDMTEPLNEEQITSFDFIHVFDRWEVSVLVWNRDPEHQQFSAPELYQISSTNGASFTVHASRTARYEGGILPNRRRRANQGWGQSLIQKIYTQLRQLGGVYKNTENIIDDFVISVMKLKNLADLIQADNKEENLVQKRMQLIDLGKNIINTVLMDSEEEFEKKASSVAGLDKLIHTFILSLAAVSDQPVSIMMGQSPSGLNATGEADIRAWYDRVAYEQTTRIQPPLERILMLLMLVKGSPFGGKVDKDVKVEFTPLWQPTEKEQAETDKLDSETITNYINNGTITADEAREHIQNNDTFDADLKARAPLPIPVIKPPKETATAGNV